MKQATATSTRHGGGPNPLDTTGLCLLSLDGGGVRGLSTLYILKSIMDRLNRELKKDPPLKPCEVFDLIGGTSTGGLIAIMLGRLEMSVDECIAGYSELAEDIFGEKLHRLPVNIKGGVQSRFDSATLETAIRKVIMRGGASETALFNDGIERGCRTFVCSIDRDIKDMVRLRGYNLPDEPNICATICEAALATSAATTFFEPVSIGDRGFADGGFGANNPVDEVHREGLQNIGLEEYKKKGAIEAASEGYLTHMAQKFLVRDCIQNLRLKQSTAATNLSYLVTEYNVQRTIALRIESQIEAPWIVPFQRNPHFVGRSAEIAQVDAVLSSETRCERVAIIGLGGVGKTQIALEYAHRLQERQPDCAVFWIPVTNVESMLEAYREIGQQLRIPNLEQEKTDVQKLVQHWLSQENPDRWLLVFDNVDNMDIWTDKAGSTPSSGHRIDYLPKSKRGSILFTTRSRKAATKLAGKNVVSVGEMDETMAKDLLEKSLTNPDLIADGGATTDLLQKLTHLPLAIVQAAAYINENDITLAEYAALLDDTEQNKIELLSEEFEDEGRYEDSKNPVATTWLISFEQIRHCEPLAAEYLSFMACVDAKNIPQSLLPPARSAKKATDAIGTLSAYSFISKHTTGQLLDLHRLVHLVTRNWLRTKGCLEKWAAKALARLEEVFPDNDHTNRILWRMYLSHARYALQTEVNGSESEREGLLWKFAMCTLSDGKYQESEQAFAEVMETRKMKLGADHPDTLTSMANLASTYRDQGRWKEAEELEVKVMETFKRVLGDEHPFTLTSMANLASTFKGLGKVKEAFSLMQDCCTLRDEVLGSYHLYTLSSQATLAAWQLEAIDISE